jgi:hypothetical protein
MLLPMFIGIANLFMCGCYCAEMMDMLTLWSNGQFATRVDDGDINGN